MSFPRTASDATLPARPPSALSALASPSAPTTPQVSGSRTRRNRSATGTDKVAPAWQQSASHTVTPGTTSTVPPNPLFSFNTKNLGWNGESGNRSTLSVPYTGSKDMGVHTKERISSEVTTVDPSTAPMYIPSANSSFAYSLYSFPSQHVKRTASISVNGPSRATESNVHSARNAQVQRTHAYPAHGRASPVPEVSEWALPHPENAAARPVSVTAGGPPARTAEAKRPPSAFDGGPFNDSYSYFSLDDRLGISPPREPPTVLPISSNRNAQPPRAASALANWGNPYAQPWDTEAYEYSSSFVFDNLSRGSTASTTVIKESGTKSTSATHKATARPASRVPDALQAQDSTVSKQGSRADPKRHRLPRPHRPPSRTIYFGDSDGDSQDATQFLMTLGENENQSVYSALEGTERKAGQGAPLNFSPVSLKSPPRERSVKATTAPLTLHTAAPGTTAGTLDFDAFDFEGSLTLPAHLPNGNAEKPVSSLRTSQLLFASGSHHGAEYALFDTVSTNSWNDTLRSGPFGNLALSETAASHGGRSPRGSPILKHTSPPPLPPPAAKTKAPAPPRIDNHTAKKATSPRQRGTEKTFLPTATLSTLSDTHSLGLSSPPQPDYEPVTLRGTPKKESATTTTARAPPKVPNNTQASAHVHSLVRSIESKESSATEAKFVSPESKTTTAVMHAQPMPPTPFPLVERPTLVIPSSANRRERPSDKQPEPHPPTHRALDLNTMSSTHDIREATNPSRPSTFDSLKKPVADSPGTVLTSTSPSSSAETKAPNGRSSRSTNDSSGSAEKQMSLSDGGSSTASNTSGNRRSVPLKTDSVPVQLGLYVLNAAPPNGSVHPLPTSDAKAPTASITTTVSRPPVMKRRSSGRKRSGSGSSHRHEQKAGHDATLHTLDSTTSSHGGSMEGSLQTNSHGSTKGSRKRSAKGFDASYSAKNSFSVDPLLASGLAHRIMSPPSSTPTTPHKHASSSSFSRRKSQRSFNGSITGSIDIEFTAMPPVEKIPSVDVKPRPKRKPKRHERGEGEAPSRLAVGGQPSQHLRYPHTELPTTSDDVSTQRGLEGVTTDGLRMAPFTTTVQAVRRRGHRAEGAEEPHVETKSEMLKMMNELSSSFTTSTSLSSANPSLSGGGSSRHHPKASTHLREMIPGSTGGGENTPSMKLTPDALALLPGAAASSPRPQGKPGGYVNHGFRRTPTPPESLLLPTSARSSMSSQSSLRSTGNYSVDSQGFPVLRRRRGRVVSFVKNNSDDEDVDVDTNGKR